MLRHLSERALDAMASARRIRVAANNLRIDANPAEVEAMCIVTQNLMAPEPHSDRPRHR